MQLPQIDRWGSLSGSRVLVRVDMNTPIAQRDGRRVVSDDFRIRASLPALQALLERDAHVVACTHLGRPDGRFDPRYTVEPVRGALETLCPGVELMENLRFDPGEEHNDDEFGRLLVKGFDYYVNEAFGVSHRAHASVMAPPMYLPSAAGPNLTTEVSTLLSVFEGPARPFVAIVGGAKVADKLAITRRLVEQADAVIIGGAMAFTFWLAQGRAVGDSLVDRSKVDECRELLATGRVHVPTGALGLATGEPFGAGGEAAAMEFSSAIPDGHVGLDIDSASAAQFAELIASAATVLWNGPMGVFEDPRFAAGTTVLAQAVANCAGETIVGGGDSAAAVAQLGLSEQMSFVSTGGGASLELLELGDLPGLRALRTSPWNDGA